MTPIVSVTGSASLVLKVQGRASILLKLQSHFAKFLRHGFLSTYPSILYLFTSVVSGIVHSPIALPTVSFFYEVSTLLTMTTVTTNQKDPRGYGRVLFRNSYSPTLIKWMGRVGRKPPIPTSYTIQRGRQPDNPQMVMNKKRINNLCRCRSFG